VSRITALSTRLRQGRLTWSTRSAARRAFRLVQPLAQPGRRGSEKEDIVADTYNGYCVKCKEKRDFEGRIEVSKTGMKMAKGSCPVCGTTVNRILGKA
jgi:Domain of unknown function (DUF5679)